jgi:hypothetical protein
MSEMNLLKELMPISLFQVSLSLLAWVKVFEADRG